MQRRKGESPYWTLTILNISALGSDGTNEEGGVLPSKVALYI